MIFAVVSIIVAAVDVVCYVNVVIFVVNVANAIANVMIILKIGLAIPIVIAQFVKIVDIIKMIIERMKILFFIVIKLKENAKHVINL